MESPLNMTVAGTAEGVLMIEGAADFLSEEQMAHAVEVQRGDLIDRQTSRHSLPLVLNFVFDSGS